MSSSLPSAEESREILRDHVRKTYQQNAFAEEWRNLPEIPSSAEIKPTPRHPADNESPEEWNDYQQQIHNDSLPHNIVDGPWPDKESYIGTHYQLHREDALASIRKSVAEFQLNPLMMEDEDTWIYTNVTVVGTQLARVGVASRVEFSTERAGQVRVRWEHSKRLTQGTIVALTTLDDAFHNICKIAIIAARPYLGGLDQNPPTVDLFWASMDDFVVDSVQKYVMIEPRHGYFESSRHMLVAMQKSMTEKFPFEKQLIHLDTDVQAPAYILEQPCLDLTSLEQSDGDLDLFNINVLRGLPKGIKTTMDESQLAACEDMLTKSVAVIQGPPGTGKTFVSVSALKAMTSNLRLTDPPIIVAAQSNHAVDQMLNHILEFEPEILRLGSQSDKSNKDIQTRTLFALRQSHASKLSVNATKGMKNAAAEHRSICDEIKIVLWPLLKGELLTAETLLKHDLITKAQSESLKLDEWAEDDEENEEKADIASWLTGDQLMRIPGAPLVNLDLPLEEMDVELEQLRDLEESEDRGFDEKEADFALPGVWAPFKRRYTGRHNGPINEPKIEKLLEKHKSLHTIPQSDRGQVYRYFEQKLNTIMLAALEPLFEKYKKYVDEYSVTKAMCSISLIKSLHIKVIGCTTTGLSRYRGLLSALRPRTLLIEEAAETSEAKIIAGLFVSLEQLILVGDHQQLQASATVGSLETYPFFLNVSMFERLVNNAIPFVMLNKQRRMISDVRELLCIEPEPFYDNLRDHESVLDRVDNRPPVPGMGGLDTYFFHHLWEESNAAGRSKINNTEADMVVEFFNYLVLNGVPAGKITVLTFYNGQRKLIINTLKKHPSLQSFGIVYFNVFTVDSYQGEENDIILLSLVRSNPEWKIGFLNNKNRLVVALSRARRGLYLFGNSATLTGDENRISYYGHENPIEFHGRESLWLPLVHHMVLTGRANIDDGLPLTCTRHGNLTVVRDPEDWWNAAAGCSLECEEGPLPCGHPCSLKCHPYDHSRVICYQACHRILLCGHGCSRYCSQECECDQCRVPPGVTARFMLQNRVERRHPSAWSNASTSNNESSSSTTKNRRRVIVDQYPLAKSATDIQSSPGFGYGDKWYRRTPRPQQWRQGNESKSARQSDFMGSNTDPVPFQFFGRPNAPPGSNPWESWNAAKHDREQAEKQELIIARNPDKESWTPILEETYKPVIVKDGVRKIAPSGLIRTNVSRAGANGFEVPEDVRLQPGASGPDVNSAPTASISESPDITNRPGWNPLQIPTQRGLQNQVGLGGEVDEMVSPMPKASSQDLDNGCRSDIPSQGVLSLVRDGAGSLSLWSSPGLRSSHLLRQPKLEPRSSSGLPVSALAPASLHVTNERASDSAAPRSQRPTSASSLFMDDAATEVSSLYLASPVMSYGLHPAGNHSDLQHRRVTQEEVEVQRILTAPALEGIRSDSPDLMTFGPDSPVRRPSSTSSFQAIQEGLEARSSNFTPALEDVRSDSPDPMAFGPDSTIRHSFSTLMTLSHADDRHAAEVENNGEDRVPTLLDFREDTSDLLTFSILLPSAPNPMAASVPTSLANDKAAAASAPEDLINFGF